MSQEDTPRKARLQYELAALSYLDAVEGEDYETVAKLWEQAVEDARLEEILRELSDGLLAEQEPSIGWRSDATKVAELLARFVPSSAAPQPVTGPLTAGDVAARIAGDDQLLSRLGAAERQVNTSLLTDRTPLPAQLGIEQLRQWSAPLPAAQGSESYWRTFRHVAVLLAMARGQQPGASTGSFLAAARPKPPDVRKGPRP